MKIKSLIALALIFVMMFAMVACNKGDKNPADTTTAPKADTTPTPVTTSAKPADTTTPADSTTAAPSDTTTATPSDTTTASSGELTPVDFSELSDAEKAALKSVMPATLPNDEKYDIACRTFCMDRADEDYLIEGNSKGSASFVGTDDGAIYGKAVKFAGKSDSKDSRGEIQLTCYGDAPIAGCKGILFYVDFSNVEINPEKTNAMCASVTINTNDVRSQGPENAVGSAVAYYYENNTWVKTTNIMTCRISIPNNFAGWIYVPASSYYDKNAGAIGDTFPDIFIINMRCYTDGYTYSADSYIIFDEITFVK